MKKTRITVVLLVVLALVLTSCSQDSAANLGSLMGKMGNNVWGIKADLRKSEAAAEKVDTIDSAEKIQSTEAADELITTVKGFIGSDQNVEAFHEEMAKPAAIEAAAFDSAVTSLSTKVTALETTQPQLAKAFESTIKSFEKLVEGLKDESSSLTKSDVVTVSLVNSLLVEAGSATSTPEAVVSKANDVLAVLKLTTGFSELNVIDDIDLSGFFSAMSSNKTNNKAVSRDDDPNTLLLALGKTLEKIANLITDDDGMFNNPKFRRFHMEAKAIKLAYEVAMSPYFAEGYNLGDTIKRVCNYDKDYNRPKTEASLDDLVMYICASVSCYVDNISKLSERFLTQYLTDKTIIAALGNADMTVLKDKAVDSMSNVLKLDGQEDQDVLWTKLIDAISEETGIERKAVDDTISSIRNYLDSGESLSNIFNNLLSENQEYIIDSAVKKLIEDLQTSLAGIIESIKTEVKYFVGTVTGILYDSGFDKIIDRMIGFVDTIKLNLDSETESANEFLPPLTQAVMLPEPADCRLN